MVKFTWVAWVFVSSLSAFAQTQPAAPAQPGGAQKLDVDALKQRYWSQGDPGLRVVQNRMYSKAYKFNIQTISGTIASDPFLTSWVLGGQVGFHIGESLGVSAMYWKLMNGFNSAHSALVAATAELSPPGFGSNSNEIQSLMGGELSWNLLYGKLSLLGAAILHFDFFLEAGGGLLDVSTGATAGLQRFSTVAVWPGLSQQMYLTRWMALKLDYRMMIYSEKVVERNNPTTMGDVRGTRTAFSPVFTLGFNFFLPP